MKLLVNILHRLFGPSIAALLEDLHVRLLNDWIIDANRSLIHPHCVWKLANGHPCEGIYKGQDFYDQYNQEIDSTYPDWYEVVKEVIGSRVGGIIVGEYQFRHEVNGLWYTAPFTHFYRIYQGKIVGVRYYMGEVSIHLYRSQELTDLSALFAFHTLN